MSSVRRLPKSMLLAPEAPGRDAQGLSCRRSRSPACDRGSIKVCFFRKLNSNRIKFFSRDSFCFAEKQSEFFLPFSAPKKHTFLEKREKRRHRTFSYKKGRPLRHTTQKAAFQDKNSTPSGKGGAVFDAGVRFRPEGAGRRKAVPTM